MDRCSEQVFTNQLYRVEWQGKQRGENTETKSSTE